MPPHPDRSAFNAQPAASLADAINVKGADVAGVSERFFYRKNDESYTVIAGPNEGRACDLALAYGLREAGKRRLQLILPAAHVGATLHRAAWLREDRRPHVWAYHGLGEKPQRLRVPTRAEATASYVASIARGDLRSEFRRATTPYHLGGRAGWVAPLVDWIAAQDGIDPAHRRSERAWHCRGRKVLSIVGGAGQSLRLRVGIHDADSEPVPLTGRMSARRLDDSIERIDEAVSRRLGGDHKVPDEHWLQAVLRRHPFLVGIEERAIREVPAWRRQGGSPVGRGKAWGRGYIDLLGLDAHGAIRIVETKLAANDDALFVLQGLDYLAYCEAYREPITALLGVHLSTPFAIQYVLGAAKPSQLKLSRFAPAQLRALADDVDWSFQSMTGWFPGPTRTKFAAIEGLDLAAINKLAKESSLPTEADEESSLKEEPAAP